MIHLSALRQYFKKHPHYLAIFIKDICRVWWWRMCGQPIVVLTTESGGLGDYLWFRSYYSAIRQHYSPQKCRIIVIGMCQWEQYVISIDSFPNANHFDIFRSMESPDNPLMIEILFFKLFHADVYLNFRARHLKEIVKANKCYFGKGYYDSKQYYENANNNVICQWFILPSTFKHCIPIMPIENQTREKMLKQPFVVIVEKGNTQGNLSRIQISTIVNRIISKGFRVFYNGNYNKLLNQLPQNLNTLIIDGYQYPLKEYANIISRCVFVVTVNTLIYHMAIQLQKPCVVISANEYESIKIDAPNQKIVFNKELQQAFDNNSLSSYNKNNFNTIQDIDCDIISNAIDQLEKIIHDSQNNTLLLV